MKVILTLINLCALFFSVCGQDSPLEYAQKAETFFLKNNDSILYYVDQGYHIARTKADPQGEVYNILMKANYFSLSGASPDSTRAYISLAKNITNLEEDPLYYKWLQLAYGELYHQISSYDRSSEFYLKYIEKCKETEDSHGLAFGYMRLGQALRHYGLFNESIKYHHLAWDTGLEGMDSTFHRTNLDYLYFALEDNQMIDSSLKIKNIANSYATSNHQAGQYYQTADLAFQFWNKEQIDSAEYYFLKTLEIVKSESNLAGIVETYGDLAMMYDNYGRGASAGEYWNLFDQNKKLNEYASLYYLPFQAEHYNAQGDPERGYQILELHQTMQNKILSDDMTNSVAEQLTKYEVSLKEVELKKANERIVQQTQTRNYLLLSLIALSTLGFYLWSRFKYRNQLTIQRVKLAEQEIKIQKQHNTDLKNERNLISMRAMIVGQEEERNRIARELHDGLGGTLSSLKLQIGQIGKSKETHEITSKVSKSTDIINKASRELRRIAQDLMPESLAKFGLVLAIEDLIGEIETNQSLEIEFQYYNLVDSYQDNFELSIYRIIQELLHNVVKHAQAKEVLIQLIQHDNQMNMTIEDDGVGFDIDAISSGRGIKNIKARIAQYDGDLKIESSSEHGTTIAINCRIPILKSNKKIAHAE